MEPIATAVAAVAAASNAIAFIKARINDVQSVADISQQIGTLFDCQKKLNDERNKQASVGDISFKSSIDAVLESKKLQEQMNEINFRDNFKKNYFANKKFCFSNINILMMAFSLSPLTVKIISNN